VCLVTLRNLCNTSESAGHMWLFSKSQYRKHQQGVSKIGTEISFEFQSICEKFVKELGLLPRGVANVKRWSPQLVKTFAIFFLTRSFVIVFTISRLCNLS
jgi:hypothetical protein